jgi:WD40 repeat protein
LQTVFSEHVNTVSTLTFSPDNVLIASSETGYYPQNGAVPTLLLWDAATGEERARIEVSLFNLGYLPDGRLLTAQHAENIADSLRYITAADGALAHGGSFSYDECTTDQPGISLSGDGRFLALGFRGALCVYDTGNASLLTRFELDSIWWWPQAVAFSQDGRVLAVLYDNNNVNLEVQLSIWDVHTHALIIHLDEGSRKSKDIALSADGTVLALAYEDGTIRLLDVASGQDITVLQGHAGSVNNLAFSLGGAMLASASDDGTVRLWGVALN